MNRPSTSPPRPAGGIPIEFWHGLIIVGAIFIAFGASLRNGWVIDDHQSIELNPHIRTWSSVPLAFASMEVNSSDPYFRYATWRPLRHLSFVIDYHIAGLAPAWFHAVNVMLHAVASILVYLLSKSLRITPAACLVGALLFAVHPVQTEVVAQAKERDGLLAVVFFLGALMATRRPSAWGAILSSVLFSCSLLSKESTVVGVGLLALLAWRWSHLDGASWRRWLPSMTAWFGITLAFLVLRHLVIGRTGQMGAMADSRAALLWTMGEVFARYVGLVIAPLRLPLSFTDIVPRSLADPGPWIGFALLAVLLVAAWRARRTWPLVTLGIGWYLVALFPVSNVIPMQQWMAVRFLYLPMAGVALLAAAGWAYCEHCGFTRRSALGERASLPGLVAGGMIAVLILMSAMRTTEWYSNDTLWTAEYLMKPDTLEARRGMAAALLRQNRPQEALDALGDFVLPAKVNSMMEQTVSMRATALFDVGRKQEAYAAFEEARTRWRASPRIDQAYGMMMLRDGRVEDAILIWEHLVAARPQQASTWNTLERLYEGLGRTDDLERVRQRRPLEFEPTSSGGTASAS